MARTASHPPNLGGFDIQEKRNLAQLAECGNDVQKFSLLSSLRLGQPHQFYRLLLRNFTDIAPLIYTPVVGDACLKWSEIYRQPEGMYLSYERDRGKLAEIMKSWPQEKVAITVVTDGSRILGLGDIGVNGMGIPIGKLALYVGCGGIDPDKVLPITVDLGTNNEDLRESKLYMGSRKPKVSQAEEEEFLDEMMAALTERWPEIVVQFEDWKNPWYTLEKYSAKYAMFNDDIQGTGAVIMGGMITAILNSDIPIRDHRAIFFGAGSAGTGVAKQIVEYFVRQGLTEDEARAIFWMIDIGGLVTHDRGDDLPEHLKYFARHDNEGKQFSKLEEAAEFVKPTILVGLSGVHNAFSESVLRKMGQWNKKPIIFPLSNPVTHCECSYHQAMKATDGRVLFAAGSPFAHMLYHGHDHHAAQGNNMYVFPGIGQGAILSRATRITDNMIYASGAALPDMLLREEIEEGELYPNLERIREVTRHVVLKVIRAAQEDEVDRNTELRKMKDDELDQWIAGKMYDPFKME